jgi:hypothetical protein
MLHVGGDDEAATESRLRRWHGDEEASFKEPTWYISSLATQIGMVLFALPCSTTEQLRRKIASCSGGGSRGRAIIVA